MSMMFDALTVLGAIIVVVAGVVQIIDWVVDFYFGKYR